jgi:hypothetical protein
MSLMASKRNQPKVADVIRRAMLSSEKSRYQLSREAGVDQAALCRFAAGSGLRTESLELLAQALGLEIVVQEVKGG